MSVVKRRAPAGNVVVAYDRCHLALYAALLDAGDDWRTAASTIMRLDVRDDDAEACWRSHYERAQWIVGAGLEHALDAFAKPTSVNTQG